MLLTIVSSSSTCFSDIMDSVWNLPTLMLRLLNHSKYHPLLSRARQRIWGKDNMTTI